ncbi:PREDICTED: DNA-directed RNA polymerases IV and V subunit 5B-like isoform X2 [Camelina sativa]|uniref:DNA-directed RNA polymerases IV and V subunit 5B-like isoform X2 n=1 Tax=Camelina sativa TaxID=90675 RepID=A0ABM1Q6B6_CAMSA|nr:PREDICTED: DNA-directed RNA polymerases IV and V subunit 5B-like isoform X2 [Camelina sativa]
MEGKGKEIAVGPSINKSSVECHKYYLARRTTMEMLRDRGYDVSDEDINLSFQQFRALYGELPDVDQLRISAKHHFDSSKKIAVLFCGTGTVKVNEMRVIAADVLNRESITGLILVLQGHITIQALKAVELFTFKITDLLVNVTKHVLRRRHQVLNDDEKESLLKKYSLEEKQLPRLSSTDPSVRYYGLETGQVMKITYKDELSDSQVTYRCVG